MRGLAKESSELSFTSVNVAGGAKSVKRSCRIYESVVSVEPIALAFPIVSMFKHFIEHRGADQ